MRHVHWSRRSISRPSITVGRVLRSSSSVIAAIQRSRAPGAVLKDQSMWFRDAAEVATLEVRHPEKLAYVTQTTLSTDDTREVIDALKSDSPFRGQS